MSSFLEKLKKGMQLPDVPAEKTADKERETKKELENQEERLEEPLPQTPEEPQKKEIIKTKRKRAKKMEKKQIKEKPEELETTPPQENDFSEKIPEKTASTKKRKVEIKEEEPSSPPIEPSPIIKKENKWFEPEGQLTVDVYQTNGEIVIQTAIAGVKPEELDISIENDMVTIRGARERAFEKEEKNYFYQECYWGRFSREIILPAEVDGPRAEATMKEGILTIRIPKIEKEGKKKIMVKR
jgi:HSP20 family protein